MNTSTYTMKSATKPIRPIYPNRRPTNPKRDFDATWRPEPCPLSREELRRIVAEQIG